MEATDAELVRRYAHEGSQDAFRELVHRHLNLVYAVAWRHLHSSSLAADVAQSVFTDLARTATALSPAQPLVAWLHVVARRTALDCRRAEQRRQAREQTAAELAAMNSSPSPWAQVEPLLDEAMETLTGADRHALLLRYFENKSLRQVGEILGTSDDAAQKRVARAVEQLRTAFLRRGIAVSSAGLTTDLLAQAMAPAPAGLGASISSGALSAALLAQTANTLSMTVLNKTLIAAGVLLIASLAYETNHLETGRNQLLEFEHKISNQQTQAQQLAEERDRAAASLAQIHKNLESDRDRVKKEAAVDTALDEWLERVSRLKDWLGRMPEKDIPEMRFLTSSDWLKVTLNNDLQTEAKIRLALSDLRRMAKWKPEMRQNLPNALRAYREDHNGQSATEITQLRPYLNPPLGDDILQRYEFIPVSASFWPERPVTNGPAQTVLHEKVTVDDDFDVLAEFSTGGVNFRIAANNLGQTVNEATAAFAKAHNGQEPTAASQALPYATRPVDAVKFKEYWEAHFGP